jgi:predicted MPP superfamily phosphohydrolase
MKTTKRVRILVLAFVLGLALTGIVAVSLHGPVFAAESPATEAFTFVQLCDTQLGKGGYEQSVSSFKQAVRLINALKVDLVVICGDLVDNFDDRSIADFKEIEAGLTMPCYPAPGNHDVGNTPTVASLNHYRQVMGEDYFSVEHKGYTFVMANTSLWRTQVPGESQAHDSWFKQTLAAASDKNSPVFVVQHHPIRSLPTANELLALFETSGVVAVLAGHTHTTTIEDYKGIQLVNGECTSTNSDGRPLGFRLWHVDSPTSITHEFIPLTQAIPTPDFNGDEIVDCADMCIMVEHWGENYALCDIAPPLFGDGIVDVQDLIALAEHLYEEILPVELVAYWKLDETEGSIAYDSVWNKDGILYGEPLWQPAGGQVDGALAFDGTDDYVSTPSVLDLTEAPFSVFAWVKGGAPGQVIISQTGGANWLLADPSEGKLQTSLSRPAGGRFIPQPLISEFIITDGNWHRVGLIWDGSNKILYADGAEVARDTHAGLESSEGGLYIGASSTLDPASFFSGLTDDVRIYNRAVTP